ncbi:MAG TPA: hypothetical protein DHW78_09190 [Ruminococcaceae bacterium]|nr:hypothetical protein [Oscillospiraceae bacterium]HCM24477.1 hypothetical protein [Oscillospiraceae bacterium]
MQEMEKVKTILPTFLLGTLTSSSSGSKQGKAKKYLTNDINRFDTGSIHGIALFMIFPMI